MAILGSFVFGQSIGELLIEGTWKGQNPDRAYVFTADGDFVQVDHFGVFYGKWSESPNYTNRINLVYTKASSTYPSLPFDSITSYRITVINKNTIRIKDAYNNEFVLRRE